MLNKIQSLKRLKQIVRRLRSRGKKIVFTNGCFDIIHVGHVEYLFKAKKLGDVLVVGLNNDSSVKKIKGNDRPINNEDDRAKVLASLCSVDYVTLFADSTPEKLIKQLKPDVLVKGGDWKIKDIVGGDFVRSYGGKVKNISFVKGYSTSSLIEKFYRVR